MKIFGKIFSFLAILAIIVVFFGCEPEPESGLPALTGTVSIEGASQVGQTLTVDTSSLGGSGTISYVWSNNPNNSNAYTIKASDVGSTITVTVSRSDNSGSVTSSPTDIITAHTPGLAYTLINNNTAYSVSKGTATSTVVIIPSVHNGLPVVAITDSGFTSYSNMTGVIIPNGVTRIGNYAFFQCNNLTSVVIPAGVTYIGNFAFDGCISLNTIYYGGTSSANWAGIAIGSSNTALTEAFRYYSSGWHFLNGIPTEWVTLVQIPAGTFTMGPDIWNNYETFTATLSAFKMGKYEVTQELYQDVMGVNPSNFSSNPAAGEIQARRPVEGVSWYDAIEFCNALSIREGLTPYYSINKDSPDPNNNSEYDDMKWLVTMNESANGYRLPTEAQWEYACKAGSTTNWYFGNDESELINYAWYSANSNSRTHQVGLKLPNAFGLYDMHGNVIEWCWDWWGNLPTSNQTDYTGAVSGSGRVGRGGSWDLSAEYARSSLRNNGDPSSRGNAYRVGFRLVRP